MQKQQLAFMNYIELQHVSFMQTNSSIFNKNNRTLSDEQIKEFKTEMLQKFKPFSIPNPRIKDLFIPITEKFLELFQYLGANQTSNITDFTILYGRYLNNLIKNNTSFLKVPKSYDRFIKDDTNIPILFATIDQQHNENIEWFQLIGKVFGLDIYNHFQPLLDFFEYLQSKIISKYGTNVSFDDLINQYESRLLEFVEEINKYNPKGKLDMKYRTEFLLLIQELKAIFMETSGIPPLTRKIKHFEDYDGSRGQLDIQRSVFQSVNSGTKRPQQRYYKEKLEDGAIVYILLDVSGSLESQGHISRYEFVLAFLIIEIFSEIARKYKLYFISSSGMAKEHVEFYDKNDIYNYLMDLGQFANQGTTINAFEDIVNDDDLNKRGENFVFVLTDVQFGAGQLNLSKLEADSKRVSKYYFYTSKALELIERPDTKLISLFISNTYGNKVGTYFTKESLRLKTFILEQLVKKRGNADEMLAYFESDPEVSLDQAITKIPSQTLIDVDTYYSYKGNFNVSGSFEAKFYEYYLWNKFQNDFFDNFFYTNNQRLVKVGEYLRFLDQLRKLNILG